MNGSELRIVLPWHLLEDMVMERIRAGHDPLKAIESADKAFRRLNELAAIYLPPSDGSQS